jgi:hypothetical protein
LNHFNRLEPEFKLNLGAGFALGRGNSPRMTRAFQGAKNTVPAG